MRVTGGELRGLRVKVPGQVRPTADRVRESLFAALGRRVVGAQVADLFAGSGVLGIEAYSRGAAGVVWVEKSYPVWRVLRENVRRICGDGAVPQVYRADVLRWIAQQQADRFDLIFCDPPYSAVRARQKALSLIAAGPMLKAGGWLILECPAGEPVEVEGLTEVWRREYGGTSVIVFQRRSRGAGG